MTIQEIKALPRTEEGVFDLNDVVNALEVSNVYEAAGTVYPAYAAYETLENKKEGYPDIMAQMRVWNGKVKTDFNFTDGAAYVAMMLDVVENMSPEIYENYRELLDMFREAVKKMLECYYVAEKDVFEGEQDSVAVFCQAVQKACGAHLLLAEKYGMCFR